MAILVTGGTGFIGSHTVVELIQAGKEVVIVDNFSNSKPEVLNRIEKITGTRPTFYEADLLDKPAIDQIFDEQKIDAVIHFAGLKAVGRVGPQAAGILPQQHHRHPDALPEHAGARLQADCLFLLRHRLRHEQSGSL